LGITRGDLHSADGRGFQGEVLPNLVFRDRRVVGSTVAWIGCPAIHALVITSGEPTTIQRLTVGILSVAMK
jgi:hypothetical protein